MKKRIAGVLGSFACLFLLMTFSSGAMAAGQDRQIKTDTQKYTLYPAPSRHDPYSVQYPIKLQAAGLITVKVEVGGGKLTGKDPLKVWIVDAEGIQKETNQIKKKYIKRKRNFKDKDTSISYPVDAGELARTNGKYVVILSNESPASHCVGTITITYPGEKASTRSASDRSSSRRAASANAEASAPRVRHKRD